MPNRVKSENGCVIIDTYYFIRNDEAMLDNERSIKTMGAITAFLLVFAPKTLAKRIVAMILLTADVPVPRVAELSGLCERSVRELKRAIAEVERGDYHTRQQIADMIEDKFQVKVSVTAVARLLKKSGIYA